MSVTGEKVIVLLSGGVDSVCALYHSAKQYEVISALTFDYGAKHNRRELPYASFHCKKLIIPHTVVSIDFIEKYFDAAETEGNVNIPDSHLNKEEAIKRFVPFRNGIMLSIAAGFAESKGANGIVIAAHGGEYSIYPDRREKFLKAISHAVSLGTYNGIKILRPFIFMTKDQVTKIGRDLGVDFSKTWSCYEDDEAHCGECITCVERKNAFNSAGITDPTTYSNLNYG